MTYEQSCDARLSRGRVRGEPSTGRSVHVEADLSRTVRFGGSVSALKGTNATTLDERVEWLLRRDQEAQRDLSDLAARLTHLENDIGPRHKQTSGRPASRGRWGSW